MPDLKTTQEATKSPLDGTELIRLATPGANWKTPISALPLSITSSPILGGTDTAVLFDKAGVIGESISLTFGYAPTTKTLSVIGAGGANFLANATSGGGKSYTFFSTGSDNANPGFCGIYNNTDNAGVFNYDGAGIALSSLSYFGWGTDQFAITPDVLLYRDGAGAIGQRRFTVAQTLRIYNTWTNSTNFERFRIDWNDVANVCVFGTEAGSGGGSMRLTRFKVNFSGAVPMEFQNVANTGFGGFNFLDDGGTNQFTAVYANSGSGLFPSTAWMGTRTATDFLFVTGTNERLRLTSSGQALHQCGSAGVVSIQTKNTDTSGFAGLDVKDSSGAAALTVAFSGSASGVYNSSAWIGTRQAADLIFVTDGITERFRVVSGGSIVQQKNSTTAQTLQVYNTFTSSTSYERGIFDWNNTANVLTIRTEKGSGGGTARPMQFLTDAGGDCWKFSGAHASNPRLQIDSTTLTNIGIDFTESNNFKWFMGSYNAGGTNRSFTFYNTQLSVDGLFIWGDTNIVGFGAVASSGLGGLISGASGVLECKTLAGSGPATFRVYNTFTNSTNYERAIFDWNNTANVLTIGTEKGSGGGSARNLQFTIDGSNKLDFGVTTGARWTIGAAVNLNGDLQVNNSNFIFWGTRSTISSGADGNILLTNSAVTSFGLLQFGGTTSSFPALKRSSALLQARLADDSANAEFQAIRLQTDSVAVASLPAAGTAGRRAFVNNATATTFASVVAGGGANLVPVYDDGTNWRIG